MGPGLARECVQREPTFHRRSRDFVPWSLSLSIRRGPSSPPLPFPSFPSSPLPAAANIACGVLMSVGMHEVREPPRSSSPPRPCLSDDVDCAELCTWGGWFGGGGRRPLAMVLLDLMIVG